jgi:hypothetical protein
MKHLITKTALLILMVNIAAKAQDIIVKKDNGRIITHVVKINDSIVNCKGIEKNVDTTFAVKTKNIKMIIYEIGNIQNFETEMKANVVEGYALETNKSKNVPTETKTESSIRHYNGSLEVGSGFTAAALFNSSLFNNGDVEPAYQVNVRGMLSVDSKNTFLIGLNANYSNVCLLTGDSRTSVHGILQGVIYKEGKSEMYLNAMGGLAFFDNTKSNFSDNILPSAHLGIGYKYFTGNNYGFFIETGLGGPYLINTGIFFY